MKRRKLKSLYEVRISGAFIVVFILGLIIKNSVSASYLSLIIGPISVVWFMKYDDAKYDNAKYLAYTKKGTHSSTND
ncbi:MAG: hypothetical protein E7G01_00885 [Enterococcus faecalis]|uniref:hypothetical protein n=1 Tax=Enterococcus TaxID=1350 RepID=UPI0001F0B138|nr:hypothetical protein [Enterococcus faecalis]EFT45762.1 hypothetical protein HMPREF9500_00185 [Enterococcus faecalis TX0017]MBO1124561.1 hypothetical protein [Enterococcus faecalis]MDU3684402.1 hypothetical protein [Enterococcus faecalis]